MSERASTAFANCKSSLREKGDLVIKQDSCIEVSLTHNETKDRLLWKILSGIISHLISRPFQGGNGTRVTSHQLSLVDS